jgi:hypothetical protein
MEAARQNQTSRESRRDNGGSEFLRGSSKQISERWRKAVDFRRVFAFFQFSRRFSAINSGASAWPTRRGQPGPAGQAAPTRL